MNTDETSLTTGGETEAALLRRFAQNGDAEAFSEIAHRHAGLVYGTCLRVTGNAQHAADLAQETFFQLLKNAGRITASLASWLHQVATRRSIDLIRRESARRRREQDYAFFSTDVNEWADISPHVDEALNELEVELREILILHFLQGQTMASIAEARSISQPTVSRRIQQGLVEIRARLRKKEVFVTVTTLGAVLPQAAQAAPAAVMQQLGMMAMTGSPGLATGIASALAKGLNLKFTAVVVFLLGVGGYLALDLNSPEPPPPVPVQATAPTTDSSHEIAPLAALEAPTPALVVEALKSETTVPTEPVETAMAPEPQPVTTGGQSAGEGGWTGGPGGLRWGIPRATKPEGGVWRFVLALRQSPERLQATFVPGAPEFDRFRQVLQCPCNDEEKQIALWLSSVGIPIEIVQTNETPDGLWLRWNACVRTEFVTQENGLPKLWKVGDPFEMAALLQKVGLEWKVARF